MTWEATRAFAVALPRLRYQEVCMSRLAFVSLRVALLLAFTTRARAADFSVATFETVVTIPVGHACMGGGIADAKEIVDPLFAKGFVLLGGEKPVVVCAVDF